MISGASIDRCVRILLTTFYHMHHYTMQLLGRWSRVHINYAADSACSLANSVYRRPKRINVGQDETIRVYYYYCGVSTIIIGLSVALKGILHIPEEKTWWWGGGGGGWLIFMESQSDRKPAEVAV